MFWMVRFLRCMIDYSFHPCSADEILNFHHFVLFKLIETLSAVGSEVLKKHPELGSLKVVFLPQVSCMKKIVHAVIASFLTKFSW